MDFGEPDFNQNGQNVMDENQQTPRQVQEINMEPKKVLKVKVSYVDKITNILQIYMKILMGRDLLESEHDAYYRYLEVNPQKKTDWKKNSVQLPVQPKQVAIGTYVNELDYHMGDIVLSFPNPDCEEQFENYEQVEALQAIFTCQKIFPNKGQSDADVLDNLLLIKAIELSIYMLSVKQKTKKNSPVDHRKKQRQYEVQDQDESQGPNSSVDKPLKPKKKKEKQIFDHKSMSGQPSLIRTYNQKDQIEKFITKIKLKLSGAGKLDNKATNQAVREALQLDFAKLKQTKKRITTNGKYLTLINKRWFRSNNDTRDFLTLLRNITYLQLGKMGFVTRNFVSSDDLTIICVLYQSDENLKIIAEKNGITKKLNFQFSDLLSLEPIDPNLRPMRLNNRLWRHKDYPENQISPKFLYLREKIEKLLGEIDFKLIARETNMSQLNQSLFNEGKEDLLHDEIGPTDEEWIAYLQYLNYLKDKIQQKRQEFIFKNDDCLLINNQKSPFLLYLARNKEKKEEILKLIKEEEIEALMIGGAKGRQIIEACLNPVKAGHLRNIAQIQEEYKNIQEKYKEVQSLLHLKKQKLIGSKHIKVCKREKLANQYLNIFRDALKTVNYKKTLLKTLWDDVGEEPFEMYVDYTMTAPKGGFTQRNRLNSIWSKYQICETGKTSLFSTMERIKINQFCLSERVNMNPMLSKKYVLEVFCLNDFLELFGESSKQQLSDIFQRKMKVQSLLDETQYEFFHSQVQQIMETEQFNQGKTGVLPETVELKHNTYQSREYSFVEPKLVNLQYIWQLNLLRPWHVPTYEIREYYGEKISLYFTFLGYYTKMLLPVGILGLAINMFQWFVEDNLSNYYVVPTVVFGFVQVQWINLVNDLWQSEEHEFAVRYGQLHCDSQSSGGKRSVFYGNYTRSIENDQMNSLSYPDFKRIQIISLNVLIIFLIFSIYASIVMGLFFMCQSLIEQYDFSNQKGAMSIVKIEVTLAATLNLIVILLCDGIYDNIASELTNIENHETISDWEMNYVFKKYFLCFLSLCGPMFFIVLINDHVGLTCINNDCYIHSQYYFSTIFIQQFTLNIWEIIKPMIQQFIKKIGKNDNNDEDVIEKGVPKNAFFKVPSFTSQQSLQLDYDDPINDPFIRINKFIEDESHKESYVKSADRYGTVNDYMEITLQYSMLSLFGMTFPLCFFIAFIWNAVELQTDKNYLLNYTQRPLPLGEKSIGVFNGVLEILSYISLLQNSGLMTYLSGRGGNDGFGMGSLAFFLCVLNINFFLRYVESSVFAEIPYSFKALMDRHKYILKSTIEKFRGGHQQGNDDDEQHHPKPYPIFKIYGCILEGGEDGHDEQFEMMSSEDELEEHFILTKSELDQLRQQLTQHKEHIHYKKEPNIVDLTRHNYARKSNWALKFNFKNVTDHIVRQRSKVFYELNLQFLAKLERLSTHKIMWADDRMSERNFFIRRSKILVRNLDWRKVLVLRENHNKLRSHHDRDMRRKYNQKLMQINENPESEQNKIDLEEIIYKSKKYIEKHSWLDCRKLIYLRIQGVWFSQFRKCNKPTTPLKLIERYKKLHNLYKAHEPLILREKKTDISIEEQFKKLTNEKRESHLKDVNFKDFSEMMEQITPEPLTSLTAQLSSRKPTALEMLVDSSKSLWHRLLSRPLGQLSYGLQSEIESQAIELYLNEIISNNNVESINPTQSKSPMIPTTARLHLIKMLNRGGQRIKQVIRTHIDNFRWLASNAGLANRNLESISILLYTEVGFSYGAHRALINNVLRFNAYRSVPGSIPVKGSLVVPYINYISYNASDPLDRIDAFLCKGYVARSYGLQQGYFINGLTLSDVLQLRSKLDLSYNDMETLQFLLCAIKTLDILDTQFGMFHGMISPSALYLVGGWDSVDTGASSYALLDVGMIYWYDNRTQQAQFFRGIGQDEIWFTSPEVMRSHFSSNSPPFEPLKADIYSLGLVVLEMMTLGRMSIELSKTLKANEGDVEAAFMQWLNINGDALDEAYPLTFKLIYEMIDSNPTNRSLPHQICMKHQLSQYADRSLSTYLYSLQEYPDVLETQLNQYKRPKIISQQVVRVFNPQQPQPQQLALKGSQVQLGEFLKEYLHRINFYLRLKSNGKAIECCMMFEKTILEDILSRMPFQKAKDSFIQMVETYLTSQLYDLLLENERMKEMVNIFKYIHQKTQVLFQGSQLDEAAVLGAHLIRFYSIVCIKITDSQRDSRKQSEKGAEILALGSKYDESGEKRKQFLQEVRTKKQLLPYLLGLRQKLLVMTENMDCLKANILYFQGDLVKAQEKVSRMSDQKYQFLATEKETLKQFQTKEENANNSIEFKMYYVTIGFASQLSKYLNLRMLKMKIETDLNQQLNSDSNKNLKEELEILKNAVGLYKLQQVNSNNQKKLLFQTLNFTQLQPQLRLSLLNFIKSLALDCQRMFLSNKIRLIRYEPTETKSLIKQLKENEWCTFAPYATQCRRTLIEWAITQKSDQLYEEIANTVTTQLTSLFLQDRLFKKFSHSGYHYLVSHLQYAQIFIDIAPLLQYLPAPQLLQLSSQVIELVSPFTQHEYAKQIVLMALYLRLIGVQYVPTLYYSTIGEKRQAIYENSNVSNSQSIIQQFKILAMQCNIINESNVVGWSQANVLDVFKLNYLWLSLYFYGSIHPDNISLQPKSKSHYDKFKSTLVTIQKPLEKSHATTFALEMQFKKAQLELTNEEPIELENYQTLVASLSLETTQLYMNLAQPWLCYLVSAQSYTAQVKWKDFINSPQFKWAMGNQTYNFIVALLQLLLNAQQHNLVRQIAQILLISLPHSMLMHKECGRNTKEIYLIWALATEQIENPQQKTGQNVFNNAVNQYNYNIPLKDILDKVFHESINLLLIIPIGDEQANIQKALDNIVKIKGVQPIVLTTFQAALKLVIYYYENACFDKAVNLAMNLENMIFNKIKEVMQVVLPEYQAQRLFIYNQTLELSQEQIHQILKIPLHEEQHIEFIFINDNVCLQMVLEIDRQAEYQQLIALRGLLRGTHGALAVAHMRIGNIQETINLAVYIKEWKNKSESQLNLLLLNFSMQIYNTMWEHDQGYLASKQMIELFNLLNCNQYLNIDLKRSAKTFKTCSIDESALFLIPHGKLKAQTESDDEINPIEDSQLLFTCLSYEETMDDINFLGIVSLNDIKVSAYIGCFECILNDPKQLHSTVQSSFAIQKFISQIYGIQSFYYARSSQIVSAMYLQFCYSRQLRLLEKELCVDQLKNLRQFKGERSRLIRWYIEERVNGKTTNEIDVYFKMKKSQLDQAILVGEEIKKGFSLQAVTRWALTAADEALRIYEQFGGSHYLMAYANLLKSDCYLFQEKVLMANECLHQSQEIMNKSYPKSVKHPDFVVLYIKQALSRQFIKKCLQSQVQTLIKLRSINTVTQMNSIFDLMQSDKTMLKFFDDYRNHGFIHFLEKGLTQFFEQKQSFRRGKNQENLEVNRKDHKEIIHLIEEAARQKDLNSRNLINVDNLFDQCQRALKRDKLKVDFIGVEELDHAMQQCKLLFKSYNNKLYKRVDELLKKATTQQLEWEAKI